MMPKHKQPAGNQSSQKEKEAPATQSPNKGTPATKPAKKLNPKVTPFKPQRGSTPLPGPTIQWGSAQSNGPTQQPASVHPSQPYVTPSRPGPQQQRGQQPSSYPYPYPQYPPGAARHTGPQYGAGNGPYAPRQYHTLQSGPPQPMGYSAQYGAQGQQSMMPYQSRGVYQPGHQSNATTHPGVPGAASAWQGPSKPISVWPVPPAARFSREELESDRRAYLSQLQKNATLSQAYQGGCGHPNCKFRRGTPGNSAAENKQIQPLLVDGSSPAKTASTAVEQKSSDVAQSEWHAPDSRNQQVGGVDTPVHCDVPNTTPENGRKNAAVNATPAINAEDLTMRLVRYMLNKKIKEKKEATEARAAKQAEAAETPNVLSGSTEDIDAEKKKEAAEIRAAKQAEAAETPNVLSGSTGDIDAELQAAFDEVDELMEEFNRTTAARSHALPEGVAHDGHTVGTCHCARTTAGQGKQASETMAKDGDVFGTPWSSRAAWPREWSWVSQSMNTDTQNGPGEVDDDGTIDRAPDSSYSEAALRTVAMLGLFSSPSQSVEDETDAKDFVGAQEREQTNVPAAAQESKKIALAPMPAVPAISAIRARAQALATPTKSSAQSANRSLVANKHGQGLTASPLAQTDTNTPRAAADARGAVPANGAGQAKAKPVSRRSSDIRVAVPELSLLGVHRGTRAAVKLSTAEPRTQSKPTREVAKTEIASSKAAEKEQEAPKKQEAVVSEEGCLVAGPQTRSEAIDNSHLDRTAHHAASQFETRIINPPPGFHGLKPVAITCRRPQPFISHPSAYATAGLTNPTLNTENLGQQLPTRAPVRQFYRTIPWPVPKLKLSDRLKQIIKTSESRTGSDQQHASSRQSQDNMHGNWPNFRNMETRRLSMPAIYQQAAGASVLPYRPAPTADHTKKEQASIPTTAGAQNSGATTSTLTESQMARIEAMKREWAGCIGKSDDVEVERLPWERMKKFYPNGPPRHMGRYVPIPDNWLEHNPLRQRPMMCGQGMSPEELLRYQANVDRIFYSGSRYWTMSMEQMIEDVQLRHVFACFLASIGVSRAEYEKEYNAYVNVFDKTYVPGPYKRLTVDELKDVPAEEITEPMITMAFRNLLLTRAEAALPDGQKTWRSKYFGDDEAPPVVVSRASPYGAIGEERGKITGKGKEIVAGLTPRKPTLPKIEEETEESAETGAASGETGAASGETGAVSGETSAAGAKSARPRRRKHLLGYAC